MDFGTVVLSPGRSESCSKPNFLRPFLKYDSTDMLLTWESLCWAFKALCVSAFKFATRKFEINFERFDFETQENGLARRCFCPKPQTVSQNENFKRIFLLHRRITVADAHAPQWNSYNQSLGREIRIKLVPRGKSKLFVQPTLPGRKHTVSFSWLCILAVCWTNLFLAGRPERIQRPYWDACVLPSDSHKLAWRKTEI